MKEDIIQFITSHYGDLTDAEKQVADYLINHFNNAIQMSVQALSKNAGVSPATPVRLAQKMGFNGYKDFRLSLAQRITHHEDLILDMNQTTNSVSESVEKVLSAEIESLKLTLNNIDMAALQEISERIKKANQILFFGAGTSQLVCSDSAIKFKRAGKLTYSTDDVYSAAVTLSNFTEKDIVICVSHSGETESACKLLTLANKLNLYKIAITTFDKSSLCKYADKILYTQTRESPLHKIALTSRVSQLAMMDALFMAYLSTDYSNCENSFNTVSENLKSIELVP